MATEKICYWTAIPENLPSLFVPPNKFFEVLLTGNNDVQRGLLEHPVEKVSLGGRTIGPEAAVKLLKEFGPRMQNVKNLDLANASIGHDGAAQLAACLPFMTSLQGLKLAGNGLVGYCCIEGIFSNISRDAKRLDFSFNPGGNRAAEALGRHPLSGLQELSLENTDLTSQGLKALLPALPPTLCTLVLAVNRIDITEITEPLLWPEGLTKLDLGYNMCRNVLPLNFKLLTQLERLELARNWLINDDIDTLFSQLKSAAGTLKRLNLQNNCLECGRHGSVCAGEELKKHLGDFVNLRDLNLSFNRLADKGVKKLLPCLSSLERLARLNLADTSIGNESATAMAGNLPTTLQILILSYNDIGCYGADALMEENALPRGLRSLEVVRNRIPLHKRQQWQTQIAGSTLQINFDSTQFIWPATIFD